MISVTVNIENAVAGALEKYREVLADKAMLHDAIRAEAEVMVKAHLLALNSRSPNTDYYADAARGVNSVATADAATVIIQKQGIGLRRWGGTVSPGRNTSSKTGQATKAIALPTKHVPIINKNRARPGDMLLAYIPNRKGGDTSGYLVEGEQRIAKKGKSKGQYITVPKPSGHMMYVLRKRTTHTADPAVLPSDDELHAVAAQAIRDLLATYDLT